MSTAPPPRSIRLAVRLMWVGAVSTLLWPVHTLTHLDALRSQVRDSLEKSDPVYADPEIHQYTSAFYDVTVAGVAILTVIGALIAMGLWVWMALKNGEGRSWARVLATVFGGVALLVTVPGLTWGRESGVEVALAAVLLALTIAIVVLLWRTESSEFYAARSRSRGRTVPQTTIDGLVSRIEQLRSRQPRTVVAVSGFAGSGKSTLAKELVRLIPGSARLRGDDFLDPERSHRRSTDWDGVERTRMRDEVLVPYRLGQPVRFRPFDWATRSLGSVTALPDAEVLVVDAIGILHPDLHGCFDLTVWVDVELDVAGARGRRRDLDGGHDHDRLWVEVWQPNDADFAHWFDPAGRAEVRYVPEDVAVLGMP